MTEIKYQIYVDQHLARGALQRLHSKLTWKTLKNRVAINTFKSTLYMSNGIVQVHLGSSFKWDNTFFLFSLAIQTANHWQ